MWVGVVWACILIFVWLWGKIRVGEWCCEVVGSCEVQQVARCSFLLPCNLICLCVCVSVCVYVCMSLCMSACMCVCLCVLVLTTAVCMSTTVNAVNVLCGFVFVSVCPTRCSLLIIDIITQWYYLKPGRHTTHAHGSWTVTSSVDRAPMFTFDRPVRKFLQFFVCHIFTLQTTRNVSMQMP